MDDGSKLKEQSLFGQWLGDFHGQKTAGAITLNIDHLTESESGTIYITSREDSTQQFPPILLNFTVNSKEPVENLLRIDITITDRRVFDKTFSKIIPETAIENHWGEDAYAIPANAYEMRLLQEIGMPDTLIIEWKTTEDNGYGTAQRLRTDRPSELKSQRIESWEELKKYFDQFIGRTPQFVFRGQDCKKRLTTTFHRHQRFNLDRFFSDDIKKLRTQALSHTNHVFDLDSPLGINSLLHLAQHHGYPTPLLDWSYSPYIASFFALSPFFYKDDAGEDARILILDKSLLTDANKSIDAHVPMPAVSALLYATFVDFIPAGNSRSNPQQALSMMSNVHDIETFLSYKATSLDKPLDDLIHAIDIPSSIKEDARNDLRLMGITAASIFPGLDGAMASLKEQNFK